MYLCNSCLLVWIMWKTYPRSKQCFVDNVDKFSTQNVDNPPIPPACVDNVENLSTQNVENSLSLSRCLSSCIDMWKLWKTYPHKMWKTREFYELMAIISYIYVCVCG